MEYRNHAGNKVSALGFGCMRFPVTADGAVDEAEARRMLDRALAAGVTYFDTAYPYHDGESERVVGRWLAGKQRSSINLATKLPIWLVKGPQDPPRLFAEQLEKLQTDYIDYYLLHALDAERWETVLSSGALELLTRLKAEGRIRHIGFSFHDEYPVFERIATGFDWDFCQLQLNYMDINEQAGRRGLALAAKRGMSVVVMEPVKGGYLANPPREVRERFAALRPQWSPSSWALRGVAGLPGVSVVLSGMSAMAQVEDNLSTFNSLQPLNSEENAAVEAAAALYRARTAVPCTGCRYCMPCPAGVEIPDNFRLRNEAAIFDAPEKARDRYAHMESGRADLCVKCRRCVALCPQHIDIPTHLAEAHAYFTAT